MNKSNFRYACYSNRELLFVVCSVEPIKIGENIHYQDKIYKLLDALQPIYYGSYDSVIPCFVEENVVKYKWVASCDDGAFEDESIELFDTKEECYNDMRNNALEKMKWNTEFKHDFDNEEDSIGYEVSFSQNEIMHKSYSGLYTYKIVEVVQRTK